GMRKLLCPCVSVTTSPLTRLRRAAVPGPISAPLSHVSLVSDFGSSCNHPLLAKRPSYTLGSGRNTTARPAGAGADAAPAKPVCSATVFGAKAVAATTPSCSQRRQLRSNEVSAGGGGAAAAGRGV